MALLGSTEDFRVRLRKLIPFSWFPRPAAVLWGALTGFATVASNTYAQLKYAKAQTRLATTTDAFLDIAAFDYCATRILRRPNESDTGFRQRIIDEVLRIRNTRLAIVNALMQLTGRIPTVIEPWNGADLGFLDQNIYIGGGPFAGVGGVSDLGLPFQIFVLAYRPLAEFNLAPTDAEIYAMVHNVTAAGITAWVCLQN